MNNNQNTTGQQNTYINPAVNPVDTSQNSSNRMPAATPTVAAPTAPSAPVGTPEQTNNVVTLGTVSNVTYADTIGDIDFGEPIKDELNNYIKDSNDYNETSLTDLNVEGGYNNMNVAPDYTSDPKVMENLHPDPEKKKTITINKEMKTFFVIALILFAFIMILPILMNLFDKIRFR